MVNLEQNSGVHSSKPCAKFHIGSPSQRILLMMVVPAQHTVVLCIAPTATASSKGVSTMHGQDLRVLVMGEVYLQPRTALI